MTKAIKHTPRAAAELVEASKFLFRKGKDLNQMIHYFAYFQTRSPMHGGEEFF
jgi:hypothetical protein